MRAKLITETQFEHVFNVDFKRKLAFYTYTSGKTGKIWPINNVQEQGFKTILTSLARERICVHGPPHKENVIKFSPSFTMKLS